MSSLEHQSKLGLFKYSLVFSGFGAILKGSCGHWAWQIGSDAASVRLCSDFCFPLCFERCHAGRINSQIPVAFCWIVPVKFFWNSTGICERKKSAWNVSILSHVANDNSPACHETCLEMSNLHIAADSDGFLTRRPNNKSLPTCFVCVKTWPRHTHVLELVFCQAAKFKRDKTLNDSCHYHLAILCDIVMYLMKAFFQKLPQRMEMQLCSSTLATSRGLRPLMTINGPEIPSEALSEHTSRSNAGKPYKWTSTSYVTVIVAIIPSKH